jgi:ketosteroid isomerase-like protein
MVRAQTFSSKALAPRNPWKIYLRVMKNKRIGALLAAVIAASAAVVGCYGGNKYAGSKSDRESLEKTGDAIRGAFARGDIDTIMAYHHPEVIKALQYNKYLVGRDAVKADLSNTLRDFHLEFKEHKVENTFFQGDTAEEESVFTIEGTPKNGGAPFLFKGRALVIYVRYRESPTGWASIREIIQPAS